TLRDLDFLAEADPPVPRQVHGERAGSGAGRRILRNAAAGSEHPRLPARARAGEATRAEHWGQVAERAEVGPQRGHLLLRAQGDVDVPSTVVVELDRQL